MLPGAVAPARRSHVGRPTEFRGLLQTAGIAAQIDVATTADDVEHSKPDADVIERALSKAQVHRTEAFYLGDTPYDIEAARRAKVAVIALRCGGWSDADLKDADALYDTPLDLLRHMAVSPVLGMRPPREIDMGA